MDSASLLDLFGCCLSIKGGWYAAGQETAALVVGSREGVTGLES